ncbi:MAG: integration host factor subunit alpha [Thiotrichales bacterium]|nr:MAG: integration host factor subunit alpha [Thiotrichales bacterium]
MSIYITKAITKADIVSSIEQLSEVDPETAKEIVEGFFQEIQTSLERDENVKLSGFGNFNLHPKPLRKGRNPHTGEEYIISPRRVVTFNPGKKFSKLIVENPALKSRASAKLQRQQKKAKKS